MKMLIAICIIVLIVAIILYVSTSSPAVVGGGSRKSNIPIIKNNKIFLITMDSCPACEKQKKMVLAKNTITGGNRNDIVNKMRECGINPDNYDISRVPMWINDETNTSLVGVQTEHNIMKMLN